MAISEDVIRSAVPGGIGKPLMLALLALLASGVLFRGGGKVGSPAKEAQPTTSEEGAGGLLGGLGGLLEKLQKGGLGDVVNSWIGHGQNHPVTPGQLGPALGPDIIRRLPSDQVSPKKNSSDSCLKLCPGLSTS